VGTANGMANQPSTQQPSSQSQRGDGSVRETLRTFVDDMKRDIQNMDLAEDVKQQFTTKLDQRFDQAGSKLG
jgi:ribosome recycling factor